MHVMHREAHSLEQAALCAFVAPKKLRDTFLAMSQVRFYKRVLSRQNAAAFGVPFMHGT